MANDLAKSVFRRRRRAFRVRWLRVWNRGEIRIHRTEVVVGHAAKLRHARSSDRSCVHSGDHGLVSHEIAAELRHEIQRRDFKERRRHLLEVGASAEDLVTGCSENRDQRVVVIDEAAERPQGDKLVAPRLSM